jgi:hypothetical protein
MTIPNWAQAELIARESDDPIIALLTITHPFWGVPQRLACDTNDVVSRGDIFDAAPFDLQIVSDDDGPAIGRLAIPNADRRIGELIQKLDSMPECSIEVIALSHPDEPIYRASRLDVDIRNIGAVSVSADLRGKDFSTEPCGTKRVIPRSFPAFFR